MAELQDDEPQGAWNFQWGDIPSLVPDVTYIHERVAREASDVTEIRQRPAVTIQMDSDLSIAKKLLNFRKQDPMDCDLEETPKYLLKAFSEDEKDSDSSEGEEAESYVKEVLEIAKATILVSTKRGKIHWWHQDDNAGDARVRLHCNSKPLRSSATIETAQQMNLTGRQACESCSAKWPDMVTSFFN